MLKNYLKVALRTLRRQKGYAAINVLGLALGLACCVLILRYVLHETSYDRFHPNAERIHRVTLLTVGWRAYRTATADPVQALRYE